MASKIDDKMKTVSFLTDEKLCPAIDSILENKEKIETIQVQINTKGYDNRKDPKMTKEIKFPFIMRKDPSIVVIGDEKAKEIADAENFPFALISEYEGNTPEKIKKRNELLKFSSYFILCPHYNKAFNIKEIIMKKKTHFMCNSLGSLKDIYENCRYTYKLKVRDWFTISFPVGNTSMPREQILDNMKFGIQFLSENLKKGPLNIKDCFVKRTTGEKLKLY